MLQGVRLSVEGLYSLSYTGISESYALVGTLQNPSRIYFVQNLTNATVTFSHDGSTDRFMLPPNGYLLLDVGTNKGTSQDLSYPQGRTLYVKGTPTGGQVNLTSWYLG